MASKSRSSNLNRHKGPSKTNYNNKYFKQTHMIGKKQIQRGGEFVYVAIDTNIILRMIDILEGRDFHNPNEYESIRRKVNFLLENSVYNLDGSINKKGKLVMGVWEEVYKEATKNLYYAKYRNSINDLIRNVMLPLKMNEKRLADYEKAVARLDKEFDKEDLFLENGKPSKDRPIWKKCSFFNMTLVTDDRDFGVYSHEALDKMLTINSNLFTTDKNGLQNTAISLDDFIDAYMSKELCPHIRNTQFLDNESQKAILSLKPPTKTKKMPKQETELVY